MRPKLIRTLLGLILLACSAVIVMDQQGAFGNEPFPSTGSSTDSAGSPADPSSGDPYNLPPATPEIPAPPDTSKPAPSTPQDGSPPAEPIFPEAPDPSASDTSSPGNAAPDNPATDNSTPDTPEILPTTPDTSSNDQSGYQDLK
ncbi:hypothetical protein D3875_12630 [Deinococcus cavernae]|uniref:Uncharacterized protein n=1 Tax=Deinococcus cavernae TaxID=2320857 RepID=A0A418V835_9DEIO|nr:hypothetical protein [Deinococcus cavernae]RJF72273.1 hypothetical protein D3875_12630 [Deinococcus cavernae]